MVRAWKSPEMASLARILAAEAIGTFFITFVAVGADVVDSVSSGTVGHVGVGRIDESRALVRTRTRRDTRDDRRSLHPPRYAYAGARTIMTGTLLE